MEADRTTHTTVAPSEAGVRGGAGSSRAFAIVHLAMHDAYFSINPKPHSTYLADLPAVVLRADTDSAIAGAAHATLSALYPTQKTFFDARHAAAGLPGGQAGADGHAFGQAVAAKILAARQNDPGLGDDGYASSMTQVGLFWGYDGTKGIGAPPRQYNQIVRRIADHQANDITANARLFALINAAIGDAGILAWDDKYLYASWTQTPTPAGYRWVRRRRTTWARRTSRQPSPHTRRATRWPAQRSSSPSGISTTKASTARTTSCKIFPSSPTRSTGSVSTTPARSGRVRRRPPSALKNPDPHPNNEEVSP
jgi:Vanadium chloroperoxidase N-terminal domain